MGRNKTINTNLPQHCHEKKGVYYFVHYEGGKVVWTRLGTDKKKAVQITEELNEQSRKARKEALGHVRSIEKRHRESAFAACDYKCAYCGSTEDLGIDHVIPFEHGGSDMPFNLVVACFPCNIAKRDKHPIEYAALVREMARAGGENQMRVEMILEKTNSLRLEQFQ